MSFLRRNIDTKGRVIRGAGALALGIAAVFAWPHSHALGLALGASAALMAFEAGRGWCALRACGWRTKF